MEEDQQFCLRWNNHQSTLISVFDTLFDNGKLVDCTLAAEGQFVKAHKVVLSACSPYFATLLTEQYDKHPIFILKDVKYQELRAMMDYMYRGEVNISQDQLAALLKAAESLQIKGLSDNRSGGDNSQKTSSAEHKHVSVPGKANVGYTLEQTKRARLGPSSAELHDVAGSREGSSSPTGTRKRRKIRRRSVDNVMADNHENSNSSQSIQINSSVPSSNVTGTISTSIATGPAVGGASSLPQGAGNLIASNVTKKTENVSKMGSNNDAITAADNEQNDEHDKQIGTVKKDQNHKRSSKVINLNEKETDIVIEPKSEYDDDGNDETVEDLTLDDEDMGLEDLDQAAGPSHGGEGSSQGYAQWQVDRSQDEVFMAAQEAQQRDPQVFKFEQAMTEGANNDPNAERFACQVCGKSYLRKRHLQRHMRDECIGIPPRFKCDLCPSRFRRKYHMSRHMTSKHGIPPVLPNDGPENLSVKKENVLMNENHENDNMAAAAALAAIGANDGTSLMHEHLRSYGLTGAITAAALYPPMNDMNDRDNKDFHIKQELADSSDKAAGMEEDWKMKLSLQLISNSLLKERLMNAMPFAYNNN